MPSRRLSLDEQMNLALDDLVALGCHLDEVAIEVSGPGQVSLHPRDGTGGPATVVAYDTVGEAQARQLVATGVGRPKIVVANRIIEAARQYLASQGWGWLDRRIGAHIPLARRDIEVRYVEHDGHAADRGDGSAFLGPPRPVADGPIRGRAGISYAAAVLCQPNDPPSLRSVARAVDMSPTAISNAVRHLADGGLLGPDHKPSLPELFWVLAEVWRPLKVVALASEPDPDNAAFAARVDQLDQPGWVLGGDGAAAELGAPIFSAERRPWLWVTTQVELRRAERICGRAPWPERAALVAIPPTPLVCRWRRPARAGGSAWPLPHPVFAALDLARDPGRGREILAQWSPEGTDHVWR